jgi:hypothetical protein
MGFLDWMGTKRDPSDALKKNPALRHGMLVMEMEQVKAQANNLRAVGRENDAKNLLMDFLVKIYEEWKKEPSNPSYLSLFTNASIQLEVPEMGKKTLEAVIKANQDHHFLDLTMVYLDLGRLVHQLHSNPEKEYWCYQMAIDAKAPPKTKYPASKRMKAKAHLFAAGPAMLAEGSADQVQYHEAECRRLAPDVDFKSLAAKAKFVQDTQG